MRTNVAKIPLYIGMFVLALSILTAAYQLGNSSSVTQTQSNAKESGMISPTPFLRITPSVLPFYR